VFFSLSSEVFEKEYFNENRIQVSVFMSVFNVHINWIPVSGKLIYMHHQPGKHYPAYTPKSSELNEKNTLIIRTKKGVEIMTRQIAGIMARRIVCDLREGDEVKQGQEIGIIKFGSRVDLFLPLNAEIKVRIGDNTRGNKTLIAKL
jgi:phosphatidylserine decarboxylase